MALEPDTLSVYPPTEITASVVKDTSLYAAKVNVGIEYAAIATNTRSFFIVLHHLQLALDTTSEPLCTVT